MSVSGSSERLPVVAGIGCLTLAALFGAAPVRAQDAPRVEAARELMDAGELSAAADSLRVQLRVEPRNPTAHWLLGRVLYWMGRGREALEQYQAALSLGPADPALRIEYADVLMALGERGRAREILEDLPSRESPAATHAEALALLGTLAYWEGNYSRAVSLFEAALERDPTHESANAQLGEIRALTRPWLHTAVDLLDDNQPYRRFQGTVEGGAYATPLWAVRAGVVPQTLGAVDGGAIAVWAGTEGYLPSLRLDLSARLGGWIGHSAEDPVAPWIGSGALALRLPAAISLRLEASRRRYVATLASADTLLMVHTVGLRLDRSAAPGWAGEALARREVFPDGNVVRTAYAWLLAPVLPRLRLGYSASWQDAAESRWTAAPGTTTGRYDPYFTPERTRVHAALADFLLTLGPTELRLDGSYGFRAMEMAPILGSTTPGPDRVEFVERRYSPWRIRGTALLPLADHLTLRLLGERERTAFYQLDHLRVGLRYTFHGQTPLP